LSYAVNATPNLFVRTTNLSRRARHVLSDLARILERTVVQQDAELVAAKTRHGRWLRNGPPDNASYIPQQSVPR
jgi:hypothetical protein